MCHEVCLGEPKRIVRVICATREWKVDREGWGGRHGARVQERTLSPQKAAVSYRCCMSASWRQRRMRSIMPHSTSSSSSSAETWNTSVLSLARGCLPMLPLVRRWARGDDRKGEDGRIDRFGSRARGCGWVGLAPTKELTRDCGPKEKDELMDARE